MAPFDYRFPVYKSPAQVTKESPEYQAYHRKVVDACAALMGEECRCFFNEQCDFVYEYTEGTEPGDVALDQKEALS